ncbi:MAG: ubiquinone/menaquinone biosynthesis methyltransferase [Candidatus Eisenbacteria bacterium]|nr:ubiquinone/menaquinone biosynthesis methyltransferase [Candidatus Eisenbacteria bacterium]
MPAETPPTDARDPGPLAAARARPHAVRELAGMFDDVSGRYDLLNSLMTLGQDRAWRRAMWRAVPDDARVVLDLCTGSGASLPGLVRPGRLVLGMDASLRMLERAAEGARYHGWAPRLACADAFRLPLRAGSLDAVTMAFGARNLRPRGAALAELARVLRPGGTLAVLEATAPRRGPLAPLHAFWARTMIPLLGRLSPDPSAYRYLSQSVFEFGAGEEFERDLDAAGFTVVGRRAFLLGASRLWAAQRLAGALPGGLQFARSERPERGNSTHPPRAGEAEWRWWTGAQAATSAALVAALAWAAVAFFKYGEGLRLEPWQRSGLWFLIAAGLAGFAVRTVVLLLRFLGPPGGRGA